MYSIEEFRDSHGEGLHETELPLDPIQGSFNGLELSRATFRYRRDWSSRIVLQARHSKELLAVGDDLVTLSDVFPNQQFLKLSTTVRDGGDASITLGPKFEPFLFGEPGLAAHAQCIVINGPTSHFEKQPLSWEAEGLVFVYSPFPGMCKRLSEKEDMLGRSVATGSMSVSSKEHRSLSETEIWKVFYRASKVLTFASGCAVGVGHIAVVRDDGQKFWLMGFSRRDPIQFVTNWYGIEMVKGFSRFASAYHSYLKDEPSTLPLLSSSDFYRASNAIRGSSLEISLISSYSALEILTHHILRDDACWTKDLLARAKFEDKLRSAAAFVGLNVDPLEHAELLKDFLKSHNKIDGYAALSEARNSIVHSEKSFRIDGLKMVHLWEISQWLVEVFTFYPIGYKGLMADRRRLTGWRGEGTRNVPIRQSI